MHDLLYTFSLHITQYNHCIFYIVVAYGGVGEGRFKTNCAVMVQGWPGVVGPMSDRFMGPKIPGTVPAFYHLKL